MFTRVSLSLLLSLALCGAGRASVFPKSPPPARNLISVNLLESPDDMRLACTVLQGLVNRKQPRIYIIQNPGWHTAEMIPKWMDGIKAKGYKFTEVSDPLTLFATFKKNVKGAVLYESNLADKPETLHKLNALTLYCALNDAVPVTDELNAKLKLPVAFDARGKLNTAREAYDWAYRELWPRANHRVIALTCPSHIVLRDYLVAHKIMPFWISPDVSKKDEDLCWRFLREAKPNSPVMGCWGGYGEKPVGRITEPALQRITSEQGKFIVVTDGCFNLTVHSGFRFKLDKPKTARPQPALDRSKVYVCLNFTDGDNLQYVQQYFPTKQWWGDPNRGKVPLSWSMGPSAVELMPDVLEYFLKTRTANDEFVCPTAGFGLMVPSLYGKELTNGPAVYDAYLKLTANGMKVAGLKSIHLGDTSGVPLTRDDFAKWVTAIPGLDGILADYGRMRDVTPANAAMTIGGVPVARTLVSAGKGGPNEASAQDLADAIRAKTPEQRPAFMHVCLINWFNSPAIVMEAMKKLGPGYEAVLPSDFFALMKQSPPP